jgi:site-specific DNA-methyltransferase (adenine-specific)
MIEILNTDCMEYMKGLEDNAFDLAIVDPPYGLGESLGKSSRNRFSAVEYLRKDWDMHPPNKDYFNELKRVSKNQIIWGANHFISLVPESNSSCWIVWDKENGASNFADSELAYTSFKTAVRNFRYRWAGMLQGDMKNKELRIHPTQKPVKLYEWLLSNYAKEGDRILDTHLGSGSSAIAAHYGGFDFVGCELDEDYFKAAQGRFEKETAQIDIFQ